MLAICGWAKIVIYLEVMPIVKSPFIGYFVSFTKNGDQNGLAGGRFVFAGRSSILAGRKFVNAGRSSMSAGRNFELVGRSFVKKGGRFVKTGGRL